MKLFAALHIPNIYCQAMEYASPELKKVPYVLTQQSSQSQKSIVFGVSHLCKQKRIHPGYSISLLIKKFPDVKIIEYKDEALTTFKNKLLEKAEQFSPEFTFLFSRFLTIDLSGTLHLYNNSNEELSLAIQHSFNSLSIRDVSLACATTAMNATLFAYSNKNRETLFWPDETNEANTLLTISLDHIPGLHYTTKKRLKQYNLYTLNDIKKLQKVFLQQHFIKDGERLYAYAHGYSLKVVQRNKKSTTIIGTLRLHQDSINQDHIHGSVLRCVDTLLFSIHNESAFSKVFTLELHYADGKTSKVQKKTLFETDSTQEIKQLFLDMYRSIVVRRISLRTIHCSALHVTRKEVQVDLFAQDSIKNQNLEQSIHAIRNKQGFSAITSAAQLIQSHI